MNLTCINIRFVNDISTMYQKEKNDIIISRCMHSKTSATYCLELAIENN